MDNPTSPDLLSGLPLSIIHIILSLLPIRDAIRTSFLSRQWRYKWNGIPDLAFGYELVDQPMRNESDSNWLEHFITLALFCHKGPINKFQLSLPFGNRFRCLDQWLLFLSKNDIRILVLADGYGSFTFLHSGLFSCQYLTHLELHGHSNIPPPPQSFKGFLWLRILRLYMVDTSSTTIESIVAHSPLLEEFILCCGIVWETFSIHAPVLKSFRFNSTCDKLSLCFPLLEEFIGNFGKIRYFNIGAESLQGSSSVFPRLRIANLSNVLFDDEIATQTVIRLITSSPNLQKLKISSYSTWGDDASGISCESAPNITYDNLKVIEMRDFCGALNEMKLIRFLLARSPVLEKVMYSPHESVPNEELPNLMAELLSSPRASANAQIWFLEERISSS